jgi:hypothetical protein
LSPLTAAVFNTGFSFAGVSPNYYSLFTYNGTLGNGNIILRCNFTIESSNATNVIELSLWTSPIITGGLITGGAQISAVTESTTSGTTTRPVNMSFMTYINTIGTGNQFLIGLREVAGSLGTLTFLNFSYKFEAL